MILKTDFMKRLFYNICITAILFIPIRVSASDIAMGNHDTIYKPGNVFIFEAKIDSVSKNTQHSCYIVMRVLDKEMYHQGVITYDYYDSLPDDPAALDSTSLIDQNGFIETTEILENSKLLWIHPPRTHGFGLLQYYPFPEIRYPVKIGKKYKRSFLSFNDPLCQCTLLLRYKMQYLSYSQWKYQNRLVEICEQSGFAKSKRGSFSVTYRYNERLGLVEAIYDYNNEVRIRLSLIKTIIPKQKKDG